LFFLQSPQYLVPADGKKNSRYILHAQANIVSATARPQGLQLRVTAVNCCEDLKMAKIHVVKCIANRTFQRTPSARGEQQKTEEEEEEQNWNKTSEEASVTYSKQMDVTTLTLWQGHRTRHILQQQQPRKHHVALAAALAAATLTQPQHPQRVCRRQYCTSGHRKGTETLRHPVLWPPRRVHTTCISHECMWLSPVRVVGREMK
jgi:hypothetical protein